MLLMNVLVEAVRGVSMMYAMTVGKEDARDSRRICPDADQTKTSICPAGVEEPVSYAETAYNVTGGAGAGDIRVSTSMFFMSFLSGFAGSGAARFSSRPRIWSTLVAKRFNDVRMPPLGPRLYCFMTSL